MIDRRHLLAGGLALTATPLLGAKGAPAFVSVAGQQFRRGSRRYPVCGTNMWYAAYLGADRPYGDRARLSRELDRLKALGIENLRILGASEQSPLKGAVTPVIQQPGRRYDEALLAGLDRALAEIGRRGMTAVVYLNNFWEWSGGMAAYLTWLNGGRFVEANAPWPAFGDFVADYYANPAAVGLYHDYIRAVVGRTNSVTGVRYADDPAVMAWQLANEPRPAGSDAKGAETMAAFQRWVRETAALIKSLAPHQLVSTGSEGLVGCLQQDACVLDQTSPRDIDYMTMHIWPQNFGWLDPKDIAGTYDDAAEKTRGYIARHVALAKRVGKPLVIEEFGFPRDDVRYDPGSPTSWRDRYYRLILDAVLAGYRDGGPLAGANFWAWNGEGRAQHTDYRFKPGDTQWMGDPSHEPQGWYGLFDADRTTLEVVRGWTRAMRAA